MPARTLIATSDKMVWAYDEQLWITILIQYWDTGTVTWIRQ